MKRHGVRTVQRRAVEEPQGADDDVEQAPRHLLFEEVQLELAEVFDAELIRRPVEVFGEPGDPGDVRFDGAGRVIAKAKVVDEPLPKRGHGAAPR